MNLYERLTYENQVLQQDGHVAISNLQRPV